MDSRVDMGSLTEGEEEDVQTLQLTKLVTRPGGINQLSVLSSPSVSASRTEMRRFSSSPFCTIHIKDTSSCAHYSS